MIKKYLLLFFAAGLALTATAQSSSQVKWTFKAVKKADKVYEVHLTANISGDYHLYAQDVGVDGPIPTTFSFTKNPLLSMDGKVKEAGKMIKKNEEVWGGIVNYYEKSVDFIQTVKVRGSAKTNLAGKVEFMVCNEHQCLPPSEVAFSVNIGG